MTEKLSGKIDAAQKTPLAKATDVQKAGAREQERLEGTANSQIAGLRSLSSDDKIPGLPETLERQTQDQLKLSVAIVASRYRLKLDEDRATMGFKASLGNLGTLKLGREFKMDASSGQTGPRNVEEYKGKYKLTLSPGVILAMEDYAGKDRQVYELGLRRKFGKVEVTILGRLDNKGGEKSISPRIQASTKFSGDTKIWVDTRMSELDPKTAEMYLGVRGGTAKEGDTWSAFMSIDKKRLVTIGFEMPF